MTTTAALYLRISKDTEGEALGVARQRKDCTALAKARGWAVVEYPENDVSASNNSTKPRPVYDQMLADVRAGKVQAVVAYSNSRLTRRPAELEDLIVLHSQTGVEFATVVSGDDNLATADGRMVARIKASVDAAEAERISERVLRKHAELRESGRMVGTRAFGWAMGEDGRLSGDLHPEESARLRDAARAVIEGGSLFRIAKEWNNAGLTTARGGAWTHSNLRLALTNPRIAGFRTHEKQIVTDSEGNPVRGRWEAILSEDEWRQVCAVVAIKKRVREGSSRHLLGGLLTCGCGGTIYGSNTRDYRSGREYVTYSCPACRSAINSHIVEPKVISAVLTTLILSEPAAVPVEGPSEAVNARLTALRAADARLLDLAIEGVFTTAEIAAKRAEIQREIEALAGEVEQATARATTQATVAEQIASIRAELFSGSPEPTDAELDNFTASLVRLVEAFPNLEFEKQRTLIRGLVHTTVHRGRKDDRVQCEPIG